MKHSKIETRSAVPLETRADPDPIEAATQAVAEMRTAFDARMAGLDELTARLDEIETRAARPNQENRDSEDSEVETRAFLTYMRTGRIETETRALNASSASAGGILVPDTMRTSIIERVIEFSPIRSLATSITMGSGDIKLPRLSDDVTVGPDGVPEASSSDRPHSQPGFDEVTLSAWEQAVIIPVSRILLEDSAVDLSAFLNQHVGKKFGQLESTWFLRGDGTVHKPIGILNSDEITDVPAGGASLDADDVIDLYHAISSAYAMRGTFLANRATMAALRKLKDTTGQYLLQPALSAGTPPTLHGRPILEAPELDDPETGNSPLLFGDFSSGFMIGNRTGIEMLRDDYTGYAKGLVMLGFRRRVGGVVTLGEAIAKLTLQ